ncbi:hydrogenase assembly chaperone HypC/HupF [Candidatus Methanoperedens nitroreducens]|uniref:Hydrogenase assembly chaperone HypC/HupF n=1 Tax=Candidatus Methanoperedens nitratireducens TaxID=1392998 RepID=A0A062VCX2_9EURY|nr:HypC/HybG/HupF family hydrogenase formation chaperone [Candidatus Methanoperedens nitroreducens]KCZ73105.1 hydrogenase assembly chaperone HypC/HupF [Candidatus Methanoperedens nitroreducens]MDJ1422949.1 HypC/HybG/HupF family hydrogenase formation chaperone [Candidatus Methanoperedens sp.]
MCLAVPARVIEVNGDIAIVEFGGAKRKVNITLIDTPNIGDYVLVHVGYAIQRMDPDEAHETLRVWEEILKQ